VNRSTLLVISHTEHFQLVDGTIVGWPSTVRELDELTLLFPKIIHVACFYRGIAPSGMMPYKSSAIDFIPIPPFGGDGLKKLSIISTIPVIVWRVFYWLRVATHFQFRAPTSMGMYLIPLLSIFTTKPGWFKYAGNWNQENPPLSYAWQRFWLKKLQKRKVTINGSWPDQPNHCLSFANPCLTESDQMTGSAITASKLYHPPFTLCFVGRIEKAKGIERIIEALHNPLVQARIHSVHFIGDGPERELYRSKTNALPFQVFFHGFQNHTFIFNTFSNSHFLVLPSDSEGFPKVVAEAANFGCIPVVSNVSSIPHYFNESCAYLWKSENPFSELLAKVLNDEPNVLKAKSNQAHHVSKQFTFEVYRNSILEKILNTVN
jgi:glycosyltransferase involved in cell wall biosynthesis